MTINVALAGAGAFGIKHLDAMSKIDEKAIAERLVSSTGMGSALLAIHPYAALGFFAFKGLQAIGKEIRLMKERRRARPFR